MLSKQSGPEVVLTDIGLPDIPVYEVPRRLRADGSLEGAALVAPTGWGAEEDKRLSEAAGFDFHFTKPVASEAPTAFLRQRVPGR